MLSNFRIVPKVFNDIVVFYLQTREETVEVGRILLPADNQLQDTMDMVKKIADAMKDRYRKSI